MNIIMHDTFPPPLLAKPQEQDGCIEDTNILYLL